MARAVGLPPAFSLSGASSVAHALNILRRAAAAVLACAANAQADRVARGGPAERAAADAGAGSGGGTAPAAASAPRVGADSSRTGETPVWEGWRSGVGARGDSTVM